MYLADYFFTHFFFGTATNIKNCIKTKLSYPSLLSKPSTLLNHSFCQKAKSKARYSWSVLDNIWITSIQYYTEIFSKGYKLLKTSTDCVEFIKQVLDNLKMYLVLIIYRTYYHANIYFVYASTSYLDRRAFTLNIGTLIINVFGKFYNLSTILFRVITTSFHISTIIINSRTTYIYARNNLFLRGETPHWKFLGLKDIVYRTTSRSS